MASIMRLKPLSNGVDSTPDLLLDGNSSLAELSAAIVASKLIAIDFPQFTDGRGYSLARTIRQRYQYKGELRAIGNILFDQLAFLMRCGFDSFEIADSEIQRHGGLDNLLSAFAEISLVYQQAEDDSPNIRQRRNHKRNLSQAC